MFGGRDIRWCYLCLGIYGVRELFLDMDLECCGRGTRSQEIDLAVAATGEAELNHERFTKKKLIQECEKQ